MVLEKENSWVVWVALRSACDLIRTLQALRKVNGFFLIHLFR